MPVSCTNNCQNAGLSGFGLKRSRASSLLRFSCRATLSVEKPPKKELATGINQYPAYNSCRPCTPLSSEMVNETHILVPKLYPPTPPQQHQFEYIFLRDWLEKNVRYADRENDLLPAPSLQCAPQKRDLSRSRLARYYSKSIADLWFLHRLPHDVNYPS